MLDTVRLPWPMRSRTVAASATAPSWVAVKVPEAVDGVLVAKAGGQTAEPAGHSFRWAAAAISTPACSAVGSRRAAFRGACGRASRAALNGT